LRPANASGIAPIVRAQNLRGISEPTERPVVRRARVSGEARWVWVAVLSFVGMSVWWLTQDDRVPDWDSGFHEFYAAVIHGQLANGHLAGPFTDYNGYPPLVHLVGALSAFAVGLHPMALILSSNIVFVPVLAFGCFGAGRIAYGPRAGLLAAVLALGSPIVVSTMHVYYLDAPQAAMVAAGVWAVLASRHFERVGIAAVAGVICGLALMTKQTSVIFLAGVVLVAALRAGPRGRRGQLAFALGVCVVAGPWYVYHAAQLSSTLSVIGGLTPNAVQSPPRFSVDSLTWYGWNLVNQQVLAPFALAFLIGVGVAVWRLRGGRLSSANVEPELLGGAFVSYVGMTLLIHKDPRYTLPMLVYVAVLATGWIGTLPLRRWRACLSATVVAVAAIYLVGVSAGIGGAVRIRLPGAQQSILSRDQLTLYESTGWLRGGPVHDANVHALLDGLRSAGIRDVLLYTGSDPIDFNQAGLRFMALAQGLRVADAGAFPAKEKASLVLASPGPAVPPPCQRLNDGSRIYVVQGAALGLEATIMRDPAAPQRRYTLICPGRPALTYP
jgi:4-amino-4-deoxy-L-arabinose transferase-like glycosyltransferase